MCLIDVLNFKESLHEKVVVLGSNLLFLNRCEEELYEDNLRMAQDMQCLHAISNYMRKVAVLLHNYDQLRTC